MAYYELGGKKFSIQEISCLNTVIREMRQGDYVLPEKYESSMRLSLDMLVLEGILERHFVNFRPVNSWSLTEYGEEFISPPQIQAEINMFAEVAAMANTPSELDN
jgi:hypothetical protein